MELDHHLVKVFLEASHIRSIKVIGGKMHVLKSWIISLSISDIGVFEDSLGLSDAFEKLVTLLV